ncbi:MAG: Hpt domain-containing protein, partial [Fimbriimonadaceae bacterium]
MSSELDMSQYLDLFLQEAEEQLEILEQETLKLEEDANSERLQVIFRAAHTLKGSSRAMGLTNFAELTHEMENILDKLRNNELQVNTAIADALLACQDTLRQMTDSVSQGQGDQVECAPLIKELQALHGDEGEAPAAPQPTNTAAPGGGFVSQADETLVETLKLAREQSPVYHAKFQLSDECVMKYARAFMAVSAIQETGEILACIPDAEKLEEEEFELEFELFFQGDLKLQDLRKQIDSLSEIEWYEVTEWDPEASSEAEPDEIEQELKLVEVKHADTASKEAETTAAPGAGGPRKSEAGQTVRVDVTRLDNLMNLVGELVIDRTRIAQIGSDLSNKFNDQNVDALEETVGHIARITGDLQDQIMKARMMPIETVFNRFPRVVRDLANKLGKEIKLELEGGETELDRSVIEVIGDPLLHILRNSVDHGVEMPDDREKNGKPRTGRIVVSAKHQE